MPFPSRTARFKQVVERCGRPEVHLSLVAPGRDGALQGLQKKGRVMTVWQGGHHGKKTDYGVVGLFAEPRVQFLVFARSLRAFTGRRIVGIDYALLASPSEGGVTGADFSLPAGGRGRKKRPRASEPEKKRPSPEERSRGQPEPPPSPEEETEKPKREPRASAPAPKPVLAPPDFAEIKRELRRVARMLGARQYGVAQRHVSRLIERL